MDKKRLEHSSKFLLYFSEERKSYRFEETYDRIFIFERTIPLTTTELLTK